MSIITKPFAWLLLFFIGVVNDNYGWAIILFAIVVKIILLPFQMKSKKSMMRMSRLNPKMKELEKKFGDDKQKYNIEIQKLYKEQGVKPMSGCLWSLIPFPILIALYAVVRQPLAKLMELTTDQIAVLRDFFVNNLGLVVADSGRQAAYYELTMANYIHQYWDQAKALVPEVMSFNLKFLGLNLGDVPDWKFFTTTDWSDYRIWLPALGLFLIPFISAGLSYFSMKVSTDMNPQTASTQGSNKSMMMMMPLVSVWICFVMPAAMGIYWIVNSVLAIIQDVILTKMYTRKLNIEDAERLKAQQEREAELEAKRRETEALRAQNATRVNENTSKKKIQGVQRAEEEKRRAAEAAAKRAAKRVAMGLPAEEETPESQVGTRRYARGRAYIPERFTDPDSVVNAVLPDDTLPSITDGEEPAPEQQDSTAVIAPEDADGGSEGGSEIEQETEND